MFMQYHGNINQANSVGTNELLKQGAKLITEVGDIIEDLSYKKSQERLSKLKNM